MIDPPPGYHIQDIPKGTLGTASKIMEEALEFQDAIDQSIQQYYRNTLNYPL